MLKQINQGFVFKVANIKQIQYKNKMVQIVEKSDCFEKTYVDTKTGKKIYKIVEVKNNDN